MSVGAPGVGPPPAGVVSALRVRLEVPRAAWGSLSLTGPQRPDSAAPGLSSSARGSSPPGKGPSGWSQSPAAPSSASLPAWSCALGPPASRYCGICRSQPRFLLLDAAPRVAPRAGLCLPPRLPRWEHLTMAAIPVQGGRPLLTKRAARSS